MTLRKEAVSKLEEEGRAWEEAKLGLENQVKHSRVQIALIGVDLLQVRSLQASSKLAEDCAASREEIHKQEVSSISISSIVNIVKQKRNIFYMSIVICQHCQPDPIANDLFRLQACGKDWNNPTHGMRIWQNQ